MLSNHAHLMARFLNLLRCRAIVTGAALIAMTCLERAPMPIAAAQTPEAVPVFEVDAAWPKPLPNNWAVGPVSGITTDDARSHLDHSPCRCGQAGGRGRRRRSSNSTRQATSCRPGEARAPATTGRSRCMASPSTRKDRVWISGNGEKDAHILAFTRQGKFLRQIGRAGQERRQQRHGEPGPRDADARRSPDK